MNPGLIFLVLAAVLLFGAVLPIDAGEPLGKIYNIKTKAGDVRSFVPGQRKTIRGILICGNGAGGDDRFQAEQAYKQRWATGHGFAIMATKKFGRFKEGVNGDDYQSLISAIDDLAKRSGHPEIRHAPLLLWGFSNGGQMAYGLARLVPERTIAFIVNKGGYYITDADGGREPINVPALFIAGERDKGKNDRKKQIYTLYRKGRDRHAPWAWLEERSTGHQPGNSEALAFAFFQAILPMRYPESLTPVPDKTPELQIIDQSAGWCVPEGHTHWQKGWMPIKQAKQQDDKTELQMGWVPSQAVAQCLRAVACYDIKVSRDHSDQQKAVAITDPYRPWRKQLKNDRVLYQPTKPVMLCLAVSPNIKDWQQLAIYDNGKPICSVVNQGQQKWTIPLKLDHQAPLNVVHAVLTLADGQMRSSGVLLLIADDQPTR